MSLQYKFAVVVMGRQEYISEDEEKVNLSQFIPHSLPGKEKSVYNSVNRNRAGSSTRRLKQLNDAQLCQTQWPNKQ